MEAHLEDVEPAPAIAPGLATIYGAWRDMGRPLAVISGMAGGIIDARGGLYIARLAWLDEHRYQAQDDRDAVMRLFSALDRVETEIEMQRLSEAAARLNRSK